MYFQDKKKKANGGKSWIQNLASPSLCQFIYIPHSFPLPPFLSLLHCVLLHYAAAAEQLK